MKRRSKALLSAKPDMTPMMDIVFILIIFFVVTASFVKEPGLMIARPGVPHGPPPQTPAENLTLELMPGYHIRHDGRLIDVWAATALMKRFHVEHMDRAILLRPTPGAELDTLVRLLDKAAQAGLPKGTVAVI